MGRVFMEKSLIILTLLVFSQFANAEYMDPMPSYSNPTPTDQNTMVSDLTPAEKELVDRLNTLIVSMNDATPDTLFWASLEDFIRTLQDLIPTLTPPQRGEFRRARLTN